jgi:GNAT superfamily N-acetyltransferase
MARLAPGGTMPLALTFCPLTEDRWDDLESLFGPRGAHSGCWCMWWRCSRREFERNGNRGNREAFRNLVATGGPTGILAYSGDEPVGWCSVAPRDSYPSLLRSRTIRPIDERPAWSLVCFFVARAWRGKGIAKALARAAVDYVRDQGGNLLEAYPTDPRGKRLAAVSSYMGTPEMLRSAGFSECARPSKARIVMRRRIRPRRR